MTINQPDRLDRIEAILANLASRDATIEQRFERYQEAAQQRFEREQEVVRQRFEREQEVVRQRFEELDRRQDITQRQIDVLLALHDETSERLDRQDRQLDLDRAEFRSTVRDILSHLQTRYSDNGDG